MNKYLAILLEELSLWKNGHTEKRIIQNILRISKNKRKELGSAAAAKEGYDIYEKRKVSIYSLIDEAIEKGYISKYSADDRIFLAIKQKGLNDLKEYWTNNYSKEYQIFKEQLDRRLIEFGKVPIEELQLMRLFGSGKSIDEVEKTYCEWNKVNQSLLEYHKYIISLTNKEIPEDYYIFNLAPKLFVPVELMDEEVELTIQGIEVPKNLIIEKPYPNQRYYVAGQKFGKEKTTLGIFSIIKQKEEFPKHLKITLIWKLNNGMCVNHYLDLSFEMTKIKGNLFSTIQHLTHSPSIQSFGLVTYMEPELLENRASVFSSDRKVEIMQQGNQINLHEKATLTNIPMAMHSGFWADPHFNRWKKITDDEKVRRGN